MTSAPPPTALRLFGRGLALWTGSGVAFLVTTFGAAAFSGRTMAGGQRALVAAAALDVAIVVGFTVLFVRATRGATTPVRTIAGGVFALAEVATALAMLLLTALVLNR